jgi:hypothetical protein
MSEVLTRDQLYAVIRDVVSLAKDIYVYPDIGMRIANVIHEKLERNEYDSIRDKRELSYRLTDDLRAESKDHHWSVIYNPDQDAALVDPELEQENKQIEKWLARKREKNYGFKKVAVLDGNIGYLQLNEFVPSEYAGETAVAAMNFVSNCDAIIIDLRKNHGGYPSMVQLLTSYMVDAKPIHINSFYYRQGNKIEQFWTFPYVPGTRMTDIPVYILTSNETGSGAEEFTYNLKNMGRAVIIGERTVGAAHPVTLKVVQNHFQVRVPYGRPINPITNDNWEVRGVEPHILVPAEDALRTALLEAIDYIHKNTVDLDKRWNLEWERDLIKNDYSTYPADNEMHQRCAGNYGPRSFSVREDNLVYNYSGNEASFKLTAFSENGYHLDGEIKFIFQADDFGKISSIVITYRDKRPAIQSERSI